VTYRIALGPRAGRKALTLSGAMPRRDGTTHLAPSPLEFLQRLAALVPRPRLLERVLDIDQRRGPGCGAGELKIVAAILPRAAIEKILTHLGLEPRPPPRGRAGQAGHAFAADRDARAIRGARHGLARQRCSRGAGCARCPASGQSQGSRPGSRPVTARSPAAFTPGCIRKGAFASCSPPPRAFAAPAGPWDGV
jgi:hypothetical protein